MSAVDPIDLLQQIEQATEQAAQYRQDFATMSDRAAEPATRVHELEREREAASFSAGNVHLLSAQLRVPELLDMKLAHEAADMLERLDTTLWREQFTIRALRAEIAARNEQP